MDDFLGFILELLFEALIEIAFSGGVDLASRGRRRLRIGPLVRRTLSKANPPLTILKFALWGIGLGVLSALIFPHALIRSSNLHGISLLISPIITGTVMGGIGRIVRQRGRTPVRIESFAYGFTFAFAMALIRYFLVH
jgi:hypothetical protein